MKDQRKAPSTSLIWTNAIGLACTLFGSAITTGVSRALNLLLAAAFLYQLISTLMHHRSTAQARQHAAEHDYNLCTKCSHPLTEEPNTVPPPTSGAVEGYRPRPWWTCPECGRSHAEGEAQEHWRRFYKMPRPPA